MRLELREVPEGFSFFSCLRMRPEAVWKGRGRGPGIRFDTWDVVQIGPCEEAEAAKAEVAKVARPSREARTVSHEPSTCPSAPFHSSVTHCSLLPTRVRARSGQAFRRILAPRQLARRLTPK